MSNNSSNSTYLLNADEKKAVNSKINDLMKKHPEINQNNFDLIEFIKDKYCFEIVEAPLDDETTGFILVDERQKLRFRSFDTHRIIVTNLHLVKFNNYLQKRRFIVAHEFGHFVLHKKTEQIQFAKRDTEHFNTKEEQEAEYFARCLLMPENRMKDSFSRYDLPISDKVEKICKEFNVTENKARYRLQELSLI